MACPEQVRVLPISEKFTDHAKERLNELLEIGARASMDNSAEKIGAKIRLAQLDKVPYMLIIELMKLKLIRSLFVTAAAGHWLFMSQGIYL